MPFSVVCLYKCLVVAYINQNHNLFNIIIHFKKEKLLINVSVK